MIKIHCDFLEKNAQGGCEFQFISFSLFAQIEICLSPRMTLNQVAVEKSQKDEGEVFIFHPGFTLRLRLQVATNLLRRIFSIIANMTAE